MDLLTPAFITASSLFTAYYYGSKFFNKLLAKMDNSIANEEDVEMGTRKQRFYDSPVQSPPLIVEEEHN